MGITSESIPSTQRAYVLSKPGGDLTLTSSHPVPPASSLLPGQVLVKLTHSGVCATDLGVCKDYYPIRAKDGLVGGHEGVGHIVAIGDNTRYGLKSADFPQGLELGARVGVKFLGESCLGQCEPCGKGFEGLCTHLKSHGVKVDGTFGTYVVSYMAQLTPIPEALPSPDAAALMCAGVTVYASLLQCGAKVGEWVVVSGAGGGLGHLAIQYAVTMGMQVIAVDTGADKRELCLSLGASHFIDFKTPNPSIKAPESNAAALMPGLTHVTLEVLAYTGGLGAHASLLFGGGAAAYTEACAYLRKLGYLMVVGIPKVADSVFGAPILLIAGKGLTIRGVYVGNRQESLEAVNIAASGKVKVHYTLRGLSELEKIFDEMVEGKIVGRVVMDVNK